MASRPEPFLDREDKHLAPVSRGGDREDLWFWGRSAVPSTPRAHTRGLSVARAVRGSRDGATMPGQASTQDIPARAVCLRAVPRLRRQSPRPGVRGGDRNDFRSSDLLRRSFLPSCAHMPVGAPAPSGRCNTARKRPIKPRYRTFQPVPTVTGRAAFGMRCSVSRALVASGYKCRLPWLATGLHYRSFRFWSQRATWRLPRLADFATRREDIVPGRETDRFHPHRSALRISRPPSQAPRSPICTGCKPVPP